MAVAASVGATAVLPGALSAAPDSKKTFTILHTNDMHSAFIGLSPALDYTPLTLNDDQTRGGYLRLAGLLAKRGEARKGQGPGTWCLTLVTTAWGLRSAPPPARSAVNCNSCRAWVTTPPPLATTNSTTYLMAWASPSARPARPAAFRRCSPRIPASPAATHPWPFSRAWPRSGSVRRHLVIERGGIRFGLLGVIGREAIIYTNAGAVTFSNDIEAAREMVKVYPAHARTRKFPGSMMRKLSVTSSQ